MSYPHLTTEQKVALFDAGFGPTDAAQGELTHFRNDGVVRHLHARSGPAAGSVEFGPWTSYWNPGVYFDSVEAAVAWAAVEQWGQAELVKEELSWDEFPNPTANFSVPFKNMFEG